MITAAIESHAGARHVNVGGKGATELYFLRPQFPVLPQRRMGALVRARGLHAAPLVRISLHAGAPGTTGAPEQEVIR